MVHVHYHSSNKKKLIFIILFLCYFVGGIEEFRNEHVDLCDSSVKSQEARPLYSPTTPIIEPQIETATASQILPFLYLGKLYGDPEIL
jgi:hypothetical protein